MIGTAQNLEFALMIGDAIVDDATDLSPKWKSSLRVACLPLMYLSCRHEKTMHRILS